MDISYENLLVLIRSCDFLPQDLINKWEMNLKKIPKNFYPLIYRTFGECKKRAESWYMKVELNNNKNEKYKTLIRDKCLAGIEAISKTNIKVLSEQSDA